MLKRGKMFEVIVRGPDGTAVRGMMDGVQVRAREPAASTVFFFCSCRARRSAGFPSLAVGFEVRPILSAGKIERPTADRTVFERPGG
jgi:hypothetical protein